MNSIRQFLGRLSPSIALCVVIATPALAVPTDISQTPIPVAVAAAVKPNIMLLMDASQSMTWTHMPDEVEGNLGAFLPTVGYKSGQCNALYYDPTKDYLLPKRADGSGFPTPVWPVVRYAGFGDFFTTPDTTVVDLSGADPTKQWFRAYDDNTVKNPGYPDAPGSAYYYKHSSGSAPLPFDGPDCRTPDTGVSRPSNGNGNWVRVAVSSTSGTAARPDERSNFAIWYTYYRTRLALTKSATSLAFTPLTDSFRVGFITMEPKLSRQDAAISPTRYLAISDFNAVQRSDWFTKLFSQTGGGASPAREGLARVGRHYAGKFDSINSGMTPDPLQYSCQQNFTIMTTDGYWNAETESRDPGNSSLVVGGSLKVDATLRIEQEDGDNPGDATSDCPVTNPYCPRPIFDGRRGNKETIEDAWFQYDIANCGVTTRYRTTYNPTKRITRYDKSFTQQPKQTVYHEVKLSQDLETKTTITRQSLRWRQSYEQHIVTTQQYIEDRFQVYRSVLESRKKTSQLTSTSSQRTQYNYEVQASQGRQLETSVQSVLTQRRYNEVRVQHQLEKRRFVYEQRQVEQKQYRYLTKPKTSETYVPADTCGPPATHDCQTILISDWTKVRDTTCSAGTSNVYPFVVTECRDGPAKQVPTAVASCTVADNYGASPNWLHTICTDEVVTAAAVAPACSPGIDGANVRTICTNPDPNNNKTTPGGAACSASPFVAGNWPSYVQQDGLTAPYVRITCAQQQDAVTYPNSCSTSGPDGSGLWSRCDQPAATNYQRYVLSGTCVAGTSGTNQRITCGAPESNGAPAAVAPTTCTSNGWIGDPNNIASNPWYRTCNQVGIAPYPTATGVQTCTANAGANAPYAVTECDSPAATNYVAQPRNQSGPPGCAAQTGDSINGWQTVSCDFTSPNNTDVAVPPSTCVPDAGTSGPNYIKVECTGPTVLIPEGGPVDPSTCPAGDTLDASNQVTRCRLQSLGPPSANAACVNGNTGSPNWIQTVCGISTNTFAVENCSAYGGEGTFGPPGNQVTCGRPAGANNAVNVNVASCTPQVASNSNSWLRIYGCNEETVFASAVVDPATCAVSDGTSSPFIRTTCTPATQSSGFKDTCVADGATLGNGWVTTQCTYPQNAGDLRINDNAWHRVASCTVGPPTFDANHVKTTCNRFDSTVNVAANTCSGQSPDSNNGYTTVSCGAAFASRTAQPSATCASSGAGADFPNEWTTCTFVEVQPFGPAPDCVDGVYGNETWDCERTPIDTNVVDASCTADTALATPPFTTKKCTTTTLNTGQQLRRTLTRSTTINERSGTQVLGTPIVTSSVVGPTNVGSCEAAVFVPANNPERATAAEVTPPGTCTTWGPPTGAPACVSVVPLGLYGSLNALADVSSYYYKTDLRTSGALSDNNVRAKSGGAEDDTAIHQHMTTFVVGLGVSGTLDYRSDYRTAATGTYSELKSGARDWPVWPDPALNANSGTDAYSKKESIDDFWHTAVNGRGTYFSAKDPGGLVSGLSGALTQIQGEDFSGAADSASTFQLAATGNFAFRTTYRTVEWTGNLERYDLSSSGVFGLLPTWSARNLLHDRIKDACDDRKILLIRPSGQYDATTGTNLVNFAWNSYTCDATGQPDQLIPYGLSPAEQAAFSSGAAVANLSQYAPMTPVQRTAAAGVPLVNFLRGQRQHEKFGAGPTAYYRERTFALGDFVNSQSIYVAAPFASYQDAGYGSFITSNATRSPTIYVGGNDGMLHAFDAASGQERWAVVPQAVLSNLYRLADSDYKNIHRYFVDGSPVVGDVFDGSSWRTILVGGLNAGGKSYYALDITDPAAPKALWEFGSWTGSAPCPATVGSTGDCNVGLTYGKPVITKVGGQWVVLFTSGYNNADGKGYLYVVNAATGALVKSIATGEGTPASPSGLAQINNFVDNTFVDNTTIRAYGGDLDGNIWRFEFPGFTKQLLGTATKSGVGQPITTRPELAEVGNKPIVFVGTGRLLGASDVGATQPQSLYAVVDPLTVGPVHTDLRAALRPLTMTQTGTGATATRQVRCTASAADCARSTGWVLDLPEVGERVNVEMKLLFGTLVVASNVPEPASCSTGGHSWLTYLDYLSGLPVAGSPLVNSADPTSGNASAYMGNSLIAGFNLYRVIGAGNNPYWVPSVRFTNTQGGTGRDVRPVSPPGGKRISWREIVQ